MIIKGEVSWSTNVKKLRKFPNVEVEKNTKNGPISIWEFDPQYISLAIRQRDFHWLHRAFCCKYTIVGTISN